MKFFFHILVLNGLIVFCADACSREPSYTSEDSCEYQFTPPVLRGYDSMPSKNSPLSAKDSPPVDHMAIEELFPESQKYVKYSSVEIDAPDLLKSEDDMNDASNKQISSQNQMPNESHTPVQRRYNLRVPNRTRNIQVLYCHVCHQNYRNSFYLKQHLQAMHPDHKTMNALLASYQYTKRITKNQSM